MNRLSGAIRNFARGGRPFWEAKQKIALALLADAHTGIDRLPQVLADQLFAIGVDPWPQLSFDDKDFRLVARLARADGLVADNLLELLHSYLETNLSRVQRGARIERAISTGLLRGNVSSDALLDDGDKNDVEMLLRWRTLAALFSASSEVLIEQLRLNMRTAWTRRKLLYPFVYYSLNNVSDRYHRTFLGYALAGTETPEEVDVIRLLLRDEIATDVSPAVRHYVSLSLHPFDATELFLTKVEASLAAGEQLSPKETELLKLLGEKSGYRRAEIILRQQQGPSYDYSENVPEDGLSLLGSGPGVARSGIAALLTWARPDHACDAPGAVGDFLRMCCHAFPSASEHELLTTWMTKWRFTETGRFLNALFHAFYMLPRREQLQERMDAMRIVGHTGAYLPIVASLPAGDELLSRGLIRVALPAREVFKRCEALIAEPNSYSGRHWINAAQFHLRESRATPKLGLWMAMVRRFFVVRPAYISGIDWEWLERLIEVVRIGPFHGNADGCFVLLLQYVEDRSGGLDKLKTAIEPFASMHSSIPAFVHWLITTYGDQATAFVRFVLTPEIILRLKLAPNYTAALTGRLYALRQCVRAYGFSDLLTVQQYEVESRTLTSAIMLKRVGSAQFSIAWEVLRRDFLTEDPVAFDSIRPFMDAADANPILGRAKIEVPYSFRNGAVAKYSLENRQWPLAVIQLQIIDAFLRHPSTGLELVLSTRFRHDTLRREFARALDQLSTLHIQGVFQTDQQAIVEGIGAAIYPVIGRWLEERMQTKRQGHDKALFDVVPTQGELVELISSAVDVVDLQGLVDNVFDWLEERLERQVTVAAEQFRVEFSARLNDALTASANSQRAARPRPDQVDKVIVAARTMLQHTVQELVPWFSTGSDQQKPSMSIADIKLAVDGVYEQERTSGRLKVTGGNGAGAQMTLPAEETRLFFDLLDEAVANATKYSGLHSTRVRVSVKQGTTGSHLRLSSLSMLGDMRCWRIAGERYLTASDAIFGERGSGLPKIAALAATLNNRPIVVEAVRKARSFHLLVPLDVLPQ